MPIPNFQQQSQSALRSGLAIGGALQNAETLRLNREQQQPIQLRQMEAQATGMEQQNERTDLLQTSMLLASIPEEDGKKLIPEMINKYQGNEPVLAGLRDLYQSKGVDYISKTMAAVQAFGGKVGGGNKDTEKMKNYDKWSAMIDGPKKDAFARSAGLADKTTKRLFKIVDNDDGTVTKYFADGTEEIKSNSDNVVMAGMENPMSYKKAIGVLDKAKESQSKNGGFALTMDRGLRTIQELDAKGFDPKDISIVQTYLAGKPLGSYIMTPDEQLYSGAIESMINAIARRESGAAIGEEETQRFFGRYMPQAGDSEKRIEQKRKALEGQFLSIRGQSGSVFDALKVTIGENPIQAPQQTGAEAPATPETPAAPQYAEGMTATGPGGAKMIFSNGQWVGQ